MNKPNLLAYEELPENIKFQLNNVTDVWKKHMEANLIGIYLHGSIALKTFDPNFSNLNLLVVLDSPLYPEKRVEIAKDIISLNNVPCPLEISAVLTDNLKNWETPGKCIFHYSNFWTESYLKRISDPSADCLIADGDFPDRTITADIRLINECGIKLFGAEPKDIFPNISDEEFWDSISYEIEGYDFYAYDIRHLANNIITLGRILSFKCKKKILSKYDAGIFTMEILPDNLKHIAKKAMDVKFENKNFSETDFPENDLEAVRVFLTDEILK